MHRTLVIQSHAPAIPAWISACVESVKAWCAQQGFKHELWHDEIFDLLPKEVYQKTVAQPVVASDLARLFLIQQKLTEYQTVIWLDSDFLIFAPKSFDYPRASFSVGREVWVDTDGKGVRCHKKVHNAFLMFRCNNSFLKFYLDSALKLVKAHSKPTFAPQFVGPKLLTALHNVVSLTVNEDAGMVSPAVARDILAGGGPALKVFCQRSDKPPSGVNLCHSLVGREGYPEDCATKLVETLNRNPKQIWSGV